MVAGAANIGGRKKTKDIFRRLGKFPELERRPASLARFRAGWAISAEDDAVQHTGRTYRGPVSVVGRDVSLFREPKDPLLENKLRIASTHVCN